MPPVIVTRDTWHRAVDTARKKAGDPNLPVWACLVHYYQLCVPSVVTPFTKWAWSIYADLDGFSHENYLSYMQMPAVLVDAFHVIRSEIDRIEKIRQKAAKVKHG